jgi:FtsZ-interacting cell division protein ZipA
MNGFCADRTQLAHRCGLNADVSGHPRNQQVRQFMTYQESKEPDMSNTVVLIVAAVVVVLLLILAFAFVARGARDKKRRAEADRLREEAREESSRVEKREAIAAETDARARAAAAEAEAKAAEAARLSDRAAVHRDEAASAREQLDTQFQRADSLDPRRKDDVDDAHAAAEKDRIKRDEVTRSERPEREEQPRRVVN